MPASPPRKGGQVRNVLLILVAFSLAGCSAGMSSQPQPEQPNSGSPPRHREPPKLSEAVAQVKSGVVRIETTYCDGSVASGSGFLVGNRMVVTVAHVIEGARSISLRTSSGVSRGEVVGSAIDREVAVVRSVHPFAGHLFSFARQHPTELDEVAVLGYPLGLPLSSEAGHVSALDRTIDLEDKSLQGMIQTDAAVNPGNSGGPMINSRGNILGLVEAKNSAGEGLAYAIRRGPLRRWLPDGFKVRW